MKGAAPQTSQEQKTLARLRARPSGPADPLRAADWAFFAILTGFALLFRVHLIGAPSLWADEGASLTFARLDWGTLWGVLPTIETNPPLYYAILKLWTAFTDSTEAMMRLPGAMAGALAAGVTFLAGHRFFGRGAGIVAGAFVALSAVSVAHAQEARAFAFVSLLVVLALWLIAIAVERIAEGEPRTGVLLLLAICLGLLPNMHYSGFFVVLVLAGFVLVLLVLRGLLTGRVLSNIALVAVVAGIVAAPAIFWTLGHLSATDNPVGWLSPPGFWDAKYVFHQTFGAKHLSFAAPEALGDMRAAKILSPRRLVEISLFLICAGAFFAALLRRDRVVPSLVAAIGFAVVLFFAVSQSKPILLERSVLFLVPLIALIAGAGVMALRDARLVFPLALVVLIGQGANLAAYYPEAEKENWRDAVTVMQEMHQDGDALVFASGPFLPVSVSSVALLRYYWQGDLPGVLVTLPSAEAMRMYRLGLLADPVLRDAGDAAFCPVLGASGGAVVLSRFPEQDAALDAPLSAIGGTKSAQEVVGLIGVSRWRGLDCP